MSEKWFHFDIDGDKVLDNKGQVAECRDCHGITQIGKGDAMFHYPGEFERRVTEAMKRFMPRYTDNLVGNSEIVFQYHDRFEDYKGKKLLIIGGGPSANEVEWQNLDYDYIWSCNHFYLNPILRDMKVDLTFIGQEVEIMDARFHRYIEKYNPLLAFELAGKWMDQNHPSGNMGVPEIPAFIDKNTHIAVMTKFYGVLGAGLRQLILSIFLGFKEVYFVGLDGLPGVNTPHAFQPGKVGSGAPNALGALDRYKLHYTHYWNYVLNMLNPDMKFYNLGEYCKHNMSKEISLQRFPLSDDIKEKIGIKE